MSGPIRLFTLEEAERTLPLVRRVASEVVELHAKWRGAVARYEALSGAGRSSEGETAPMQAAREEAGRLAERIDRCLRELEGIGCLFKGFDAGLVDFYSLRNDRPVFLCWRLGEDRIEWWHEIETGFAGRQPIDRAILTETAS